MQDLIKFSFVRAHEDAIVCAQDMHSTALEKHAIVVFGAFESDGFKLRSEVEIPNATAILATINVPFDIHYPLLGDTPGDCAALWHFHEHWSGSGSLRIGLHIVDLLAMPTMQKHHA